MLVVLVGLAAFVGAGPVLADGTPVAKPDDQTAAHGTVQATTPSTTPSTAPSTTQSAPQASLPGATEQASEQAEEEQELFEDESRYDPSEAGNPLRIVAYVLHPVGVILDTLIFRPAYWLGSHEPIKTLVGQTD